MEMDFIAENNFQFKKFDLENFLKDQAFEDDISSVSSSVGDSEEFSDSHPYIEIGKQMSDLMQKAEDFGTASAIVPKKQKRIDFGVQSDFDTELNNIYKTNLTSKVSGGSQAQETPHQSRSTSIGTPATVMYDAQHFAANFNSTRSGMDANGATPMITHNGGGNHSADMDEVLRRSTESFNSIRHQHEEQVHR